MFSKFSIGSSSHISGLAARAAIAGAVLAAVAAAAPAAIGSVITWGTPADVSGDGDVSTAGTLVSAYYDPNGPISATTITINGVTFTSATMYYPYNTVNAGVDTITASSSGTYSEGAYEGFGAPSGFSTAYTSLLNDGVFAMSAGTPLVLTLNGLTSGRAYQLEVWVNDTRTYANVDSRTETVGPTGDQVTLAFHTGTNGAGQFVLGTFSADSNGSQAITLTGNQDAQINAFQLRETVPEPAALGLMGVGGLGILLLGKRRRA